VPSFFVLVSFSLAEQEGWLPEQVFLPKLVWFRLRCQAKLKQLMLTLAKNVKVKPGRLYFYYQEA
jgi:hypothetical protein